MSYEGMIVKVRWCVRVRLFFAGGRDFVSEHEFDMGQLRPAAAGRRPAADGVGRGMSDSNPFATRFTRPGQLPPFDAAGKRIDLDALLALAGRIRRAVIIGPHGSGESTLLAACRRQTS